MLLVSGGALGLNIYVHIAKRWSIGRVDLRVDHPSSGEVVLIAAIQNLSDHSFRVSEIHLVSADARHAPTFTCPPDEGVPAMPVEVKAHDGQLFRTTLAHLRTRGLDPALPCRAVAHLSTGEVLMSRPQTLVSRPKPRLVALAWSRTADMARLVASQTHASISAVRGHLWSRTAGIARFVASQTHASTSAVRRRFGSERGRDHARPVETKARTVEMTAPRIGAHDPCPCGSGRKYRKCHGIDKTRD